MAARADDFIVDALQLMDAAAIRNERFTVFALMPALADNRSTLEWLARRRLIRNQCLCQNCGRMCSFTKHALKTDGFRWKCPGCGWARSVREGSFFSNSKLSLGLKAIVFLIYWWALDGPQTAIIHELGISKKTCIDWRNFIRGVCAADLERHPVELGGVDMEGNPLVVEIYESYYFHRNCQPGVPRRGGWVFGASDRQTGRCIVQVVPNRKTSTLQPLIEQWLLPGTHIISDRWAASHKLRQINDGIYLHDVVVRDPLFPEIHTNNVERMWSRAKKKIRKMSGTSRALFPSYLQEFMWRNERRHTHNFFGEMIVCIAEQYDVL